ncbi:AAA family ATPase [Sinorhizobium meliloti]|nr:AAA family ATPase [Sinorhizobium meliloti]
MAGLSSYLTATSISDLQCPHKVFLTRLKLSDFRNYATLALDLDQRHVVLTGENGAGKTNLMEAVSFLSPGRGLRRAAYADVARVGAPRWFLGLRRR